jgi:hypothetical protein
MDPRLMAMMEPGYDDPRAQAIDRMYKKPPNRNIQTKDEFPPVSNDPPMMFPGMKGEDDLEAFGKQHGMASERDRLANPRKNLMQDMDDGRGSQNDRDEAAAAAQMPDEELLSQVQNQMAPEEDAEFEGDPNNPDMPSEKDYELLERGGGDAMYKAFVDRFGFEALNRNRNDPSYVPMPRDREPHLDYNNPIGPRVLDLDEIINQGADLSQRNVDDARGEYGLEKSDIDELIKHGLAPKPPGRRRR